MLNYGVFSKILYWGHQYFNKLRFAIEITGNRNISLCWVAIYSFDNDSTYDTKSNLIISKFECKWTMYLEHLLTCEKRLFNSMMRVRICWCDEIG